MRKLKLFLLMMLLSISVAHATVWPRTYGGWNRLGNGGTVSGTIKVPVIFVSFSQANSDDSYVVSDANQTAWINNLNATSNYGGNQYFKDMSYGNVNVQFVKVGTYTANNKASNWSGNNRATLAANAIQNVTYATGFSKSSWSDFDSNGDDFVDAVLIVFAGHADGDNRSTGSSVSSINPHSSFVDSGNGTTYTGISKKFSRYVLINDLGHNKSTIANLGTALHELGHGIFDLPDYYGGSNVSYMGFWDCMDYGTFFGDFISTPNPVPGLSAFSRMLTGWLTPKELTYGQHVTLHPLNNNAEAYMIKESDTHYYILEARAAKTGSWDAGLTSGLILTEVNEADGGSWIINHSTNGGKVKVVRADKTAWTSSNYSSNINTQPFGPNVKAIDSSYGSIFATKTVENIVVNSDGSVEFDFMGGDPDNTMSLEDLTDGTIVQVSNFYGLGTLVNDNNTVKAVGGSQNIVDRYYTDGRTYNTSYSATPSTTDANHLWQVMSNNGQKYLVNVGTAQTINVANPTALISTPTAINISAISNLSNAYTLSSTEGKMSASVFQNIPAGYAVDNTLVSGYSPNSDKFTYNGTFSSSKILHIDMNLSTCTDTNENVISIGQQDLSAWKGKLIHMYYTRSDNSLEINFMTSSGSSRVTVAPKSDNLVIELSSAGLTVDGTLYTPASYGGLSDIINLSTIYAGSQEGSGRSRASNYNISIGHNNYVDSTYPVSAIATDDYTTAWVFREVTGVTPRTQQEVFGGDAPTPTTATITVTPTSKTLEVGEALQLTATTNSNATVTYSSNDSNVATVSNTGLVTAVGAGTATITVSVPANTQFTAANTTCEITVNEAATNPDEPTAGNVILWDGNSSNKNLPASRIPALVKTNDGSLLAFSDVRYNRMDIGQKGQGPDTYRIDLQMRRSTDDGKNWSAPVTIAEGNANCGYGDASVVADNASGKVLMMCAAGNVSFPNSTSANPIKIHKFVSDDNGQNWTDKGDITDYIYNTVLNNASKAFFSSGKMTQGSYRKPGAQYNRIYVSLVTANGSQVAYSDDFGDTWAILGNAVGQSAGDEAHVVELPNGDILLVGRAGFTETKRYVNLFTYTNKETGTGSWGTQGQVNGTTAAGCHGDIDLVPALKNGNPTNILLQSAPTTNAPRRYVTYYYKELADADTYSLSDFTSGWTKGLQVYDNASAYSSLRYLGNGVEAILYEKAETNYSGGASASNDPNPAGYDITFSTNTIAEITNNAFSTEEGDILTYIYTDSEDSSIQLVGEYIGTAGVTTPSVTLPDYCEVSGGTWDGNVYKATVTANYPFTPSTSSTEYYYFVHSSNNAGLTNYWMASDAGVTFSATQPTDLDNGTWAFIGNWATGFAIKNKAGYYMYTTEFVDATTSDNGTQIGLSATNSTIYELVVETYDSNVVGEFKVGSHYLSFYSSNKSYLSYYGSNHVGIRFYFTESETIEVEEPEEGVVGKLKMGVKQIETTGTITYYKKTTTAPTKDSSTEFLIMSQNTYWALCDDVSKSVSGPGESKDYEGDVNVSGKPYTFTWTSKGYLKCNNGNYLNASGTTLSFDNSGSTVWTIAKQGQSNIRISYASGNTTYYITSPSVNAGPFTLSTRAQNISLYTSATKQGTIYTGADPYPFKIKAEYATLYCEDAYKMPGTDIVGYFIKDAVDQGVLTYQKRYQSGDIVPAKTSLLLTGTPGNYEATLYEEKTTGTETAIVYTDAEDNQLEGRRDVNNFTWSERNNVYYYKLTWKDKDNHDLGVYFYWGAENGEAFELANPYTAYLAVDKDSPSRSIIMPGHDDVNSIGVVEFQPTDNAVYTISGMRVNDSTNLPSGIYIRNGKKFFVR